MKLVTAPNGTILKLFGTSKEMPAKRYSEFQKQLLLQAGIGSDLESISGHFTKLYGYVAEKQFDESLRECENLHFSIHSVLEGIDFTSLAYSCLIYSIGDEIAADLSEDGLTRTSGLISELGLSIADMEAAIDEVKKKISEELRQYFPRLFPESEEWSYFEKVKQKLMLTGDLILKEEGETDGIRARLQEINRFFVINNKPLSFSDKEDNCLVEVDKSFGVLCAMLDTNGATNSQDLTLFDFYARIEYMSRSKS